MRIKILLGLFSLLFIASACSEKNTTSTSNNSLLLLEVNYVTNTFKGGKEYIFSTTESTDTVPVVVTTHPCDFCNLKVEYTPTSEFIFEGKLNRGPYVGDPIIYPKDLNPANTFDHNAQSIVFPGNSQFQVVYIDEDFYPSSYRSIWNAVSDLKIVSTYYRSNKKIGIFLFTPIIGTPGSEHLKEWSWYIVMYK